MKRIIVFIIIALFLAPIISRSVGYFKQNTRKEAKVEPDERQLIGRVSERNSRVKEIQEILQSHGFDVGEADGFMGPQSRQAIKKFQEAKGLKSTGTIDRSTLTFLEVVAKTNGHKEGSGLNDQASGVRTNEGFVDTVENPKSEELKDKTAIHDEILNYRLNSKEHIRKIQLALKTAGFYKGEIDGEMGSRTKSAIKEFQKAKKLNSDGVVGPRTWEALSQYWAN